MKNRFETQVPQYTTEDVYRDAERQRCKPQRKNSQPVPGSGTKYSGGWWFDSGENKS